MKYKKDELFRIIVYCVSLYLILIKHSVKINIVGWIILISHIYKDITNLDTWPIWCEMCGVLLAILLISGGLDISNYFVILLGILKLFAHIRQYLFKDNQYYYNI
jgi:hypothetical protein